MSIKHKWPGWFVFAVFLFCCADLKAVDKDVFADKKGDLPAKLQNYTKISKEKITFTVKANEPIVSMELHYREKFSFTAIQPSPAEKECTANFKYGECGGLVKWTRSDNQFLFHGVPVKASGNVTVDIEAKNIKLVGDSGGNMNVACGLEPQPSHGLFKKKVNISISAVTCAIAFEFDASEFKLLATPPPPVPSPKESKVPVVEKSGSNWWIFVLIALGVIVIVLIVVAVVVLCCCRTHKKKMDTEAQTTVPSFDIAPVVPKKDSGKKTDVKPLPTNTATTGTISIPEGYTIDVDTVDPISGAPQPKRLTSTEFQAKAQAYITKLKEKGIYKGPLEEDLDDINKIPEPLSKTSLKEPMKHNDQYVDMEQLKTTATQETQPSSDMDMAKVKDSDAPSFATRKL